MPMIRSHGKKIWLPEPRKGVLRGTPLNPPSLAEIRYYGRLQALILQMTMETEKELQKLYQKPVAQEYFAQDASLSSQARILLNALIDKFQGIFDLAAKPLAEKTTQETSKSSELSLRGSLKEMSGLKLKTDMITGELKEIFAATITENVGLIKSIPQKYFTQIQGEVMRSITTGKGEADLVPFLKNQTGVELRRAKIISRDQTRKAFSNLNAARMKQVGIDDYEWLHSAGGQKPRKLHQEMSGHFYKLSDPPIIDAKTGQRGKPGDLINCRCRMIPVIKFDEGE